MSTRCSVGSAPGAAPGTASATASASSTVHPTSARIAGEDITLGLVREILIVDDHEEARGALLGMVEAAGYPAVAFANPAGALARVAEQRPALILLDMMMPEIDGADFLVRLRRLRGGDAVPVIVVSGIGHLLQGLRGADVAAGGRPPRRPCLGCRLTAAPALATIECRVHDPDAAETKGGREARTQARGDVARRAREDRAPRSAPTARARDPRPRQPGRWRLHQVRQLLHRNRAGVRALPVLRQPLAHPWRLAPRPGGVRDALRAAPGLLTSA
ncbi:MAG: response regulator [Candidatus Rokuibacteriota bacterium]|nr:MAG: response regulator [Candidatus Rokubacteria bacterium]